MITLNICFTLYFIVVACAYVYFTNIVKTHCDYIVDTFKRSGLNYNQGCVHSAVIIAALLWPIMIISYLVMVVFVKK